MPNRGVRPPRHQCLVVRRVTIQANQHDPLISVVTHGEPPIFDHPHHFKRLLEPVPAHRHAGLFGPRYERVTDWVALESARQERNSRGTGDPDRQQAECAPNVHPQYDTPMLLLAVFAACQSMPTSGEILSPVHVESATPDASAPAAEAGDSRFDLDPEPFVITSDEMAKNATGTQTPAGPDASGSEAAAAGAPALAPPPIGLPPLAQFPVRLVSTLPTAQPPRAILGLPSGQEVVVAPGSVLAPEGLVVMSIGDGRVQLAKIQQAGDHAQIDSIEISAQYP